MDQSNWPAFPSDKHLGLTEREYFAGLFLQALITSEPQHVIGIDVKTAVASADALLEALASTDGS